MAGALHPSIDPRDAVEIGDEVGRLASAYAANHDQDGTFVEEGYAAVRKLSYGCLPVPKDLGGSGHGLEGMCRAQAAIAKGCASTSLAIAMHTHAVLTMAWRRGQGDTEVEGVLRRVATEGLVLAASGTLHSAMISVHARAVEGGFEVSGRRRLVSGAPGADCLVTAARLQSPTRDHPITVLAPLSGAGVTIVDDWDSLGMRGSGSNSVAFNNAFVPAQNALYVDRGGYRPTRPQAGGDPGPQAGGDSRGLRMPGLHISLPIIGSAYLGAADAACQAAIGEVAGSSRADNPGAGRLTGLMVHEIRMGWWALEGMIRDTTDDSLGSSQQMITTLLGKRQMVVSAIRAVEAAIELLGSSTYTRGNVFERTLRDARRHHPSPPPRSQPRPGGMGDPGRGSSRRVLEADVGTWADNSERILAAVDELPDLPWALRLVVDQDGRDTGFALLRGLIGEEEHDVFREVASTHRLIGVMQWWGFPAPEYSWGGESYEVTPDQPMDDPWGLPEIAACEAWTHCTRDPDRFLPPDKPRFMLNNSDFVDMDLVWETAHGPWPDPTLGKRWDVVCAYSGHWYDEIQKNWSLGRRCVERLAGDLGLSILLLSRSGIPDVPDLPTVEVRPRLSWDECIGCLARSRLTLLPNHMDPSPRLITESLAAGVPILAYSGLFGGWKYVQPETGRFFDSEFDVTIAALRCLSTEYDTRAWLNRAYGRDRAAQTFAEHLRNIGGPDHLRYALPSSLFR